jgi:hypothetical protein
MKWPKFHTPLHLHIQYIVSYTETDEILLLLSSFPHYYSYMGVLYYYYSFTRYYRSVVMHLNL